MKACWRYVVLGTLILLSLWIGSTVFFGEESPKEGSQEEWSPFVRTQRHRYQALVDSYTKNLPAFNGKSYLLGHDVDRVPGLGRQRNKMFTEDIIWKKVKLKHWMSGRTESTKRAVNCRTTNCFNWSRCQEVVNNINKPIGIHVYPTLEEEEAYFKSGHKHNIYKTSNTYRKILNVVESSDNYEPDASQACLFIPRFDTLSRDPKDPFFIKQLNAHFSLMDEGRNHLVFNLFSGSWPNYDELDFLGFDPKMAILVKASCTLKNFRPGFDISLPLFDERLPEKSPGILFDPQDPSHRLDAEKVRKKSLLVFKGKRYTIGIGSEARNALHHLHNGRDVLIYTTCRHGKDWEKNRDDRCDHDNEVYDTVDYQELMENSTFCLIPRGRRPDTYRFLEALSLGCIPVVLSNDLVKPFSEVIDWSQVVVHVDERHLFQLPEILRSFELQQIQSMRIRCLAIYDTYFSSVDKIVKTVINIMTDRIRSQNARSLDSWNVLQTGLSCTQKS